MQRFAVSHLTSIIIKASFNEYTFNLIFLFHFYSPLLLRIIFNSRSFLTSEQIGLHVMLISVPFCSLLGPSLSSASLAVRANILESGTAE